MLEVIFPLDYWPLIEKYSTANGLDPYLMAALIAAGIDVHGRRAIERQRVRTDAAAAGDGSRAMRRRPDWERSRRAC